MFKKISLVILFSFYTALSAVEAATTTQEPLNEDTCSLAHLGSKTPYQPQQSSATYEKQTPQCEPIFISILSRHGSRAIRGVSEIQNLVDVFEKSKRDSLLTEKGLSVFQWIKDVENSQPKGELTKQGESELFEMGKRMGIAYPKLLSTKPVLCESTFVNRAKKSLESFKKGLSSIEKNAVFEEKEKQTCEDLDLFFFGNCKKFHGYYENENKKRGKSFLNKILRTERSKVLIDNHLRNLFTEKTVSEMKDEEKIRIVIQLYTLCGHEYNLDRSNADQKTCSVLSPEIRKLLEFAKEDIGSFYRSGPVHHYESDEYAGISYKMACMPLKSFIQDMEDAIQEKNKYAGHLRFAHGETVLPLAVLMGIVGTDSDLATEKNPQWESSKIISMGSNIQVSLYKCSDGKKPKYTVKLLYNEKETHFPIPQCQKSYYCDWNEVKTYYEKRMKDLGIGSCSIEEWNTACGIKNRKEGEDICKKIVKGIDL